MENEISLILSFLLGLSSSLHCVGMCGGIISALSYSPAATGDGRLPANLLLIISYNAGRIASYSLAGVCAGLLASVVTLGGPGVAYLLLQCLASLFLLALGFHIAGFLPQLRIIETAGSYFWNLLRPLAGKFLPADNVPKSICAGMLWGWIPCGLVYSVLVWTLSSADPVKGGLYMLAFGLGTMPSMVLTGLFSKAIFNMAKKNHIRRVAGIIIVLMGAASFYLNLQSTISPGGQEHEHHQHMHDESPG